MINNKTQNDGAAITEIGDRLWSQQGRVDAAHFCYLLVNHPFQILDNMSNRLVLLGADHRRNLRTFVTPEAVQRTEIFEYAMSLGNAQFSLPSLLAREKHVFVLQLC